MMLSGTKSSRTSFRSLPEKLVSNANKMICLELAQERHLFCFSGALATQRDLLQENERMARRYAEQAQTIAELYAALNSGLQSYLKISSELDRKFILNSRLIDNQSAPKLFDEFSPNSCRQISSQKCAAAVPARFSSR